MAGEGELELLVGRFYAKVREDSVLGPLFNEAVHDWPEHLTKLQAFWSSVMLTSRRYKGSPVAAHLRHAARIEPAMFDRWLALWREAAADTLSGQDAAAITAKAERIAKSVKLALFFNLRGGERPAAA